MGSRAKTASISAAAASASWPHPSVPAGGESTWRRHVESKFRERLVMVACPWPDRAFCATTVVSSIAKLPPESCSGRSC